MIGSSHAIPDTAPSFHHGSQGQGGPRLCEPWFHVSHQKREENKPRALAPGQRCSSSRLRWPRICTGNVCLSRHRYRRPMNPTWKFCPLSPASTAFPLSWCHLLSLAHDPLPGARCLPNCQGPQGPATGFDRQPHPISSSSGHHMIHTVLTASASRKCCETSYPYVFLRRKILELLAFLPVSMF